MKTIHYEVLNLYCLFIAAQTKTERWVVGAVRNAYNILSNLMGISHLEGTEAQERIILKCILKKQVVGC
jgi:hypothetical protein